MGQALVKGKSPILPILFAGVAMSLGWGIRGNFGHETGAMIPGALIGLAICLISGREDWLKRWPFFGILGAVGWAFGGQMSYGIVIGYTRAADFVSVAYGYSGLFLIGGLWGAVGAGFLMLAVLWKRDELVELIPPFLAVIVAWLIEDALFMSLWGDVEPDAVYYFDTDWFAPVAALAALLLFTAFQWKISHAVSFMLHLTLGWIVGLLVFVTLLGWHLSPPRSDNWAGMVGLFAGLLIFFIRNKLTSAIWASLLAFWFSGIAFSTGDLFQTLGSATGISLDWWKVMEQSFGLIMGMGVAWIFLKLRTALPALEESSTPSKWPEDFSVFFVLGIVPFLNYKKAFPHLLGKKLAPETLLGIHTQFWFLLAFFLFLLVLLIFLIKNRRWKLSFLPELQMAKALLFFLEFLWLSVAVDFLPHLLPLNRIPLIVEGSFWVSGVLLTLYVVLAQWPVFSDSKGSRQEVFKWRSILVSGLFFFVILILAQTFVSLISHEKPLPGAHIRFEKSVKN